MAILYILFLSGFVFVICFIGCYVADFVDRYKTYKVKKYEKQLRELGLK
jgi:hypothetical protein